MLPGRLTGDGHVGNAGGKGAARSQQLLVDKITDSMGPVAKRCRIGAHLPRTHQLPGIAVDQVTSDIETAVDCVDAPNQHIIIPGRTPLRSLHITGARWLRSHR